MITVLYLHETGLISGAENSLLQLAGALDRNKVRPVFVCPDEGGLAQKLRALGVRVHGCTFPPIRTILGVFPTVGAIRRIIREEGPQVIHSQSIRTGMYGAFARGRGQALIWHLRNLVSGHDSVDPERLLSFIPDRIICNSNAVRERLCRWGRYPKRSCVVYSGVDTKNFSPENDGSRARSEFGIAPDARVVGIASRFHSLKGHDLFFQAAARVLSLAGTRYKPVFLVVGDAVFDDEKYRRDELKRLIEALNIGSNVIFTGRRDDMPNMYAAMDMLVLTSSSEACGRVVLEAMASGCPVIGTRVGGTPELIAEDVSGYLFPLGDAQALAGYIDTLCADHEKAQSMGRAARQRACSEFPIEKTARRMEAIYEELCHE